MFEVGFVEMNVNVGTGLGERIVSLPGADAWDGVEAEGVDCADVERGAAAAAIGNPAEEQ